MPLGRTHSSSKSAEPSEGVAASEQEDDNKSSQNVKNAFDVNTKAALGMIPMRFGLILIIFHGIYLNVHNYNLFMPHSFILVAYYAFYLHDSNGECWYWCNSAQQYL